MAGRPPIDLDQKVRDLLTHTVPLRAGVDAPIRNFEERTNACFNLIKYIDDHISTQPVYRTIYDRHMSLLNRMVLVSLVEAFERFVKETAVVCVDAIAHVTIDNRFDQFSPTGGSLAAQFNAGSVGKAMCESDTWLSNILRRFVCRNASARAVDQTAFWKIIDASRKKANGDVEAQLGILRSRLEQLEPDEIVQFGRIFEEYHIRACTWISGRGLLDRRRMLR